MRVEKSDGSFDGLFYRNPMLAVTMAVALMSMAGIPPLAGFAGKFFVFVLTLSGASNLMLGLVILAVVTSLISAYYYFRVIVTMFQRSVAPTPLSVSWGIATFHFLLIAGMVALGIFPPYSICTAFWASKNSL